MGVDTLQFEREDCAFVWRIANDAKGVEFAQFLAGIITQFSFVAIPKALTATPTAKLPPPKQNGNIPN